MSVPVQIKQAMELEAEAERKKRKTILESEAQSEFDRNIAEGRKRATILTSEAQMNELQNLAMGEAYSIRERAKAVAESLKVIGEVLRTPEGEKAVTFQIAKEYIAAFEKIAQKTNTIIVPSNVNDMSGMIAQALAVYKGISKGPVNIDTNISKEQAIDELAKNLGENKEIASKLKL
jgi:regulator of protease activity HflC (stomatin/prohibitin superfamily)